MNQSYSKGISWINDVRIPFEDDGDKNKTLNTVWNIDNQSKQSDMGFGTKKIGNVSKETGRFPANLLVSDDMLNDGTISKGSGHKIPKRTNNSKNVLDLKTYHRECAYEDKGSNSKYYNVDKWFEKLLNED
jgi:hypothetical protein